MDTRITEHGKAIAALLFGQAHVGKMTDLVGSEKLQDFALLRRAAEVVEMLLDEAEAEGEFEKLKNLPPEQLAEDAKGSDMTDEKAMELLARARARADAQLESEPAAPPEPSFEDKVEDLLDLAWIQLIGLMPPDMIKKLAPGKNLTDEQAEAMRRHAKAWVETSDTAWGYVPES